MTVAELIEKLREMPQDREAWVDTGEGYARIGTVEVAEHLESQGQPVMIYPDPGDM